MTDLNIKEKNKKKNKEILLVLPININDINKIEKDRDNVQSNSDTNVFTLGTNSSSEEDNKTKNPNIKKLLMKLEEKDELINSLKKELNIYKYSGNIMYHGYKKVSNIDFNIKRIDNKIVFEKMSTCCWWCHYEIENEPIFLPERYNGKTYYITGIFCTFPCAAKYNACVLDDYKTSERYSFLKQMFNEMFNTNDDIKLAEDWRFTKKHGGYMDISEFRSKSASKKIECQIIYPPMYFSNPSLIEISKNGIHKMNDDKPSLQRSKPLPRYKNTLMESMGMTVERKN